MDDLSKRKTPISPETEQLLREVLHYDPETGEFRWTRTVHSHAVKGSLAGTIGKKGYRIIQLNKRLFSGQQLAMFLTKGKWPEFEVDHINGNKLDNRMVNLRDVNHSVNMRNQNIPHKRKHTNSGYIGVSYHKASGKWSATLNYKNVAKKHIGIYDTPEEAYGYYFAAKLDHEWKRRK